MIVGRVSGKSSFHRELLEREADSVEFRAIGKSKTARRQTAKQTDESGSEKGEANRSAYRPLPASNKMGPQKWQDEEVSPDHELEIVPFPRRQFEKQADQKNHYRREKKNDFLRSFVGPAESISPKPPDTQTNECENERDKNPEVHEPEFEKWAGEMV